MNRRSFFMGASAALAASRVCGANTRVNVGIVGLGRRGLDHVSACGRIADCEVTALCDVDSAAMGLAVNRLGKAVFTAADMRRVCDLRNVDALTIATPNHWHALAAVIACQAGKDVYVEAPASHDFYEGGRMTDVANRTTRIVQVGFQRRSAAHRIEAARLLRQGAIGNIWFAKAVCWNRREPMSSAPESMIPAGLDWDLFLGPTSIRAYRNDLQRNWRWFWDTGNGDIGDRAAHELDTCRWGLGDPAVCQSVLSIGTHHPREGADDQQTADIQQAAFDYGVRQLVCETRRAQAGAPWPGNTVGAVFLGARGRMWIDDRGFQAYKGDGVEKIAEGAAREQDALEGHLRNFMDAMRSRRVAELRCGISTGVASSALCHFANTSYRLGRRLACNNADALRMDSAAERLLHVPYRRPWTL